MREGCPIGEDPLMIAMERRRAIRDVLAGFSLLLYPPRQGPVEATDKIPGTKVVEAALGT